jgi:hypothetical protein
MVKRTAHNGCNIGSNPIGAIVFKMYLIKTLMHKKGRKYYDSFIILYKGFPGKLKLYKLGELKHLISRRKKN